VDLLEDIGKPTVHEAVQALIGNVGFYTNNGQVVFLPDASRRPDVKEIEDKLAELSAEWDRTEYRRLRKSEFDDKDFGEQSDMMYHDMIHGTTNWIEWVASIKEKYPKPE